MKGKLFLFSHQFKNKKRMKISEPKLFISGLLMVVLFSMCSKKDDNTGTETENKNPTASLSISPNSGTLETDFVLDASASTDPETSSDKLEVKWDWEGDGTWDTDYSDVKKVSRKYTATGTFFPEVMVKDEEGLTSKGIGLITVNGGGGTAPSATISVSPGNGNTETLFSFDASGSNDLETPNNELQFRWDFDGDGTWDSDFDLNSNSSKTFSTAGSYTAYVEVLDTDNMSDIASITIIVEDAPPVGCPETFTDSRDGKIYKAIEIGDQCWMAENLNVGIMLDGNSNQTNNATLEKYCYDDNQGNCDEYGGLYQWDEMMAFTTEEGATGICPNGWHIPSDVEWQMLEVNMGMSYDEASSTNLRGTDEGTKLKVGGSSGFEGLLAGDRLSGGGFSFIAEYATFSTSSGQSNLAWSRYLFADKEQILRNKFDKTFGYSVRCVKD
jgi:uncharacterized protein (TIGR02145 family)